jgi:hypothetical protein
MPVRSNIFQRLVAEIHRHLDERWVVTESKLMIDNTTGELREVDVVAEASLGTDNLVLAIEVRDRGRPADVGWVEQLVQKHEDLGTPQLVLWSSVGFTDQALKKAKHHRAITVTPGCPAQAPWAQIAQGLVGGSVTLAEVQFKAVVDVKLRDGQLARWPAPPSLELRLRDGGGSVLVQSFLERMQHPDVRKVVLDRAAPGAGEFFAEYRPPQPLEVQGPRGEIGDVIRLFISMATNTKSSPLETRSVLYEQTVTTLAEAKLNVGILSVVAKETETGAPIFSANLSTPSKLERFGHRLGHNRPARDAPGDRRQRGLSVARHSALKHSRSASSSEGASVAGAKRRETRGSPWFSS